MRYFLTSLVAALLAVGLAHVLKAAEDYDDNPEYGDEFEGDILLEPGQTAWNLNDVNPLNAIWDPYKRKRWTNNILYYKLEVDYSSHQQERFDAGILDLVESVKVNNEYCIQIKKRTTQSNYVYVVDGGGSCSSFLGMIGGRQRMSLSPGCLNRHGTIMHEFIHALGFHHEQKRADRDNYVTIKFENILSGKSFNFNKLVLNKTVDHLGTVYDYGSVMHYGSTAFTKNGQKTIVTKDPSASIGQRLKLSDIDKERIQILYRCISPSESKYFKHLEGKQY